MQGICARLTWEDLCWIALCYANLFGVAVFNASILNWLGVNLPSIYMHCPRSSRGCSSMQDICAWLTWEGHMKCNGIQGIYALLTGGSICLLYICIVIHLAVGVVVCNASVLDWLGGHLPSVYMHYPRSSSGCSSMQCICAWLTGEGHMKCNSIQDICAQLAGEDLCLIALCYAHICGVPVVKAHILDWLG